MTNNTNQPLIEFSDVTKRFGILTVLDQFNFSVAKGEKVTLIGPSGSGKSTVLRILMTLEPFQEGKLTLADISYHEQGGKGPFKASEKHLRQIRNHVGMVFQSFNLFPHMTVLRNIVEAPVRVLGIARAEAEARAIELLKMVGLAEKRITIQCSFPAGSSSVSPLPAHLPCVRVSCFLMSRPQHSTRSWWARFFPLSVTLPLSMI